MEELKCKRCGDVIESKDTHDLVYYKCGSCAIDSEIEYGRVLFKDKDDFEFLTEDGI